MAEHGHGTALIFARTETAAFFDGVWNAPTAKAALFLQGRLWFRLPDGSPSRNNAGAPSVLVAYGEDDAQQLASSGIAGRLVRLTH
jgi:hypothetical protein